MKVEFRTIYDESVLITNVDQVSDAPDAVVITSKCGEMLKMFMDATDDCTPLLYSEHLAIPKSCIKKEIHCKE